MCCCYGEQPPHTVSHSMHCCDILYLREPHSCQLTSNKPPASHFERTSCRCHENKKYVFIYIWSRLDGRWVMFFHGYVLLPSHDTSHNNLDELKKALCKCIVTAQSGWWDNILLDVYVTWHVLHIRDGHRRRYSYILSGAQRNCSTEAEN